MRLFAISIFVFLCGYMQAQNAGGGIKSYMKTMCDSITGEPVQVEYSVNDNALVCCFDVNTGVKMDCPTLKECVSGCEIISVSDIPVCFIAGDAVYKGWLYKYFYCDGSFTQRVFDRNGAIDTTDFIIVDCPCNGANLQIPQAADDYLDVIAGEVASINAAINDIQCPVGEATTYVLVSGSEVNVTVITTVSLDGLFQYTALSDGAYSFDYEIYCDGNPSGAIATVSGTSTIVVEAVDDPIETSLTDTPISVSVGDNDTNCGTIPVTTYVLIGGSELDVAVTPASTSTTFNVEISPSADCWGGWEFQYEIYCDGVPTGEIARVYGDYCLQPDTDAWVTTTTTGDAGCVDIALTATGAGGIIGTTNGAFNPLGTWWSEPLAGQTSFQTVLAWDLNPEGSGTPLPDGDVSTGTITITFDKPVTNPVLHIDRLGGNSNNGSQYQNNSSEWTLISGATSLTRLSGTIDFLVNGGNTITRTLGTFPMPPNPSGESGDNTNQTAAGSVRLNGTFTTVVFEWTGVGVEAAGADGVEIIITNMCN